MDNDHFFVVFHLGLNFLHVIAISCKNITIQSQPWKIWHLKNYKGHMFVWWGECHCSHCTQVFSKLLTACPKLDLNSYLNTRREALKGIKLGWILAFPSCVMWSFSFHVIKFNKCPNTFKLLMILHKSILICLWL